jgi:hypothetical protein
MKSFEFMDFKCADFFTVVCRLQFVNKHPDAVIVSAHMLQLARLKGFEPLTHSLEGCCSIHLSYRRIRNAGFGMVNSGFERPWSMPLIPHLNGRGERI